MSVIIRLQNLPWSANALDIRKFFKGLSIPEGGVHIIGGEMGDAFIAFSTDEDARKAMLCDREKLNEVQVRLLLSSRAEMQKVIEKARQHSLLALQNATQQLQQNSSASAVIAPQPPIINTNSLQNLLAHPLGQAPSFLTYQQQAGITLDEAAGIANKINDAPIHNQDENERVRDRRRSDSRERRRSRSRDRDRNSSTRRRDRHERSRDRSRSRSRERSDRKSNRRTGRRNSRDRSRDRSRERSRERSRNLPRRISRERDVGSGNGFGNRSSRPELPNIVKPKAPIISPWSVQPNTNIYHSNFAVNSIQPTTSAQPPQQLPIGGVNEPQIPTPFNNQNLIPSTTGAIISNPLNVVASLSQQLRSLIPNQATTESIVGTTISQLTTVNPTIIPPFQNYVTSSTKADSFSINMIGNGFSANNNDKTPRPFALQNPYTTALQAATLNSNSQDSNTSLGNPPIKEQTQATNSLPFATVLNDKKPEQLGNEQAIQQQQQEPIAFANVNPYAQMYPHLFEQAAALNTTSSTKQQQPAAVVPSQNTNLKESNDFNCCIKISNMCSSTTYSDLRKFFSGLFIPHNGIKMVNDDYGQRIGTAFVQFSRVSSVYKALTRDNTTFKSKLIKIEIISDAEFLSAEDSYRPAGIGRFGDKQQQREDNNSYEQNQFNKTTSEKQNVRFDVLYMEDLPPTTTEQDIMRMFSAFTIVDLLLTVSTHNRREYIAYVKFSRDDEARTALEDKSQHIIGNRKIHVRPGSISEMLNVKEKLRLANEQLMKEEAASLLALEATRDKGEMESDDMYNRNTTNDDLTEDGDNHLNNIMPDDKNIDDINDDANMDDNNFRYEPNDNQFSNNQRRRHHNPFSVNAPNTMNNMQINDNDNHNNNNINNNMDPRLERPPNIMNQNYNNNLPQMDKMNNTNNPAEQKFIIVQNCDYKMHINDLGELLTSANLRVKHIEPLKNKRNLFSGEFIVELLTLQDVEIAITKIHNLRFRNRHIRVSQIMPQEIANRLGKPFMNYFPGARARNQSIVQAALEIISRTIVGSPPENMIAGDQDIGARYNNNQSGNVPNLHGNGSMKTDDVGNSQTAVADGIPDKFNTPGCVLAMRNVPFKAEVEDILRFFEEYRLNPEDIIRRYNDDGTPTGDARVAFESPAMARDAYESRKRRQIYNRNIYLSIV